MKISKCGWRKAPRSLNRGLPGQWTDGWSLFLSKTISAVSKMTGAAFVLKERDNDEKVDQERDPDRPFG